MIPALVLDGVRTPHAFSRSPDAPSFKSLVKPLRVTELHAGEFAVFDNLKAHQIPQKDQAIEGAARECITAADAHPGILADREGPSNRSGRMCEHG